MSGPEETAPVSGTPSVRKGRPTGRPDATQRKRRTGQEISGDKIRAAHMKLDTLREAEANTFANTKHERRSVEHFPLCTSVKRIMSWR